ncbi:MAG: hypothetical protein ACTSR8_02445 [Promethearchaeota archaeon]
MIHSVWIVNDGICLIHVNCTCLDIEDDLLTGLFSAISSFAEVEIKRNLNSITIGEFKFLFEKENNLYFIVMSEKNDNEYLLHKKIIRIQIHFLEIFQTVLSSWQGNVSIFESFKQKLEKILSCSMENTVLYCEYCENLILDKYLIEKIDDFHTFFFCNESCKEHFKKLYSKYIHHGHEDSKFNLKRKEQCDDHK